MIPLRRLWPFSLRTLVSLGIGVALALVGSVWLLRIAIFVALSNSATGVVSGIQKQQPDSSEWTATFTYTDARGVHNKASTTFMSLYPYCSPFKSGDVVPVLYDEASPERARINSFVTLWLEPLFYVGFGAIFCIGGAIMYFAARAIAAAKNRAVEDSDATRVHSR